jgi:hypothetical protein
MFGGRITKVGTMVLEVLSRAGQVVCSPGRYARMAAPPSSIFYGDQKAEHESRGAFRR